MRPRDELELLLAPAARTGEDPLAEALGRLADLPAQRSPIPSARLAAFLADGDRSVLATAVPAPAVLASAGPPPASSAPRARRLSLRLRQRTAAGWALRLSVATGGLLLVGGAAMAAIGHSDRNHPPTPRDTPVVNGTATPGSEPEPAHRSPSGAAGSASGTSTASPSVGTHDRPPAAPAPPALLPPPASDRHGDAGGSSRPVDGSHDGGQPSAGGDGGDASHSHGTGDGGTGDGGGTTEGDGGSTGGDGGSTAGDGGSTGGDGGSTGGGTTGDGGATEPPPVAPPSEPHI